MAALVQPVPSHSVFPTSLYFQDPPLYCKLIHFIQDTCGLTEADRLVLLGVLKHMPVLQLSESRLLVTRVLSLDQHHLKLLADLFTAGLLDARSWGGLRKGASRLGTSTTTSASASGLTTPAIPLTSPGFNELFQKLGISSPFPARSSEEVTLSGDRSKRSAKLSRDCLKRQNNSCPLTTRTENALETAHLIPHSVAAMSSHDTAFWLLHAVCLGPVLRDHLYAVVRDAKSYSTMNGLVLDASMHRYYDAGIFVLLPSPDEAFDPTSSVHLDVTFRWRSSTPNLKTCCTMLPPNPASQVTKTPQGKSSHTVAPQLRQIQDGDVFRLFTDDPKRLPLPHPFLLSLHALLWRMIGSSGLAETTVNKRKRLTVPRPHRDPASHLDDEGEKDDGDDSGDNGKGKRMKRGRGGHQGASRSASNRKDRNREQGSGSKGNRTVYDDGPLAGSSNSAQQKHPDAGTAPDARDGVSSMSPHAIKTGSPTCKVFNDPNDSSVMTFLEKEYLAFKLRNLASTADGSASDSEGTGDDTSEEEDDWTTKDYGSLPTPGPHGTAPAGLLQQPTFLELEFARFHKQVAQAKSRQCPVSVSGSGSESEHYSDYFYDSDSDGDEEAMVGDGEARSSRGIMGL